MASLREVLLYKARSCFRIGVCAGKLAAYNERMGLQGVTIFCFAASYGVALAAEIVRLLRPSPLARTIMLGFAAAGLFAHTLFLIYHSFTLDEFPSSLLFLSWILAVFYLYGAIHHWRQAWGVFVLPVVLGLVVVTETLEYAETGDDWTTLQEAMPFWARLHAVLLILGAVGICVSFVASVMYLVHARQLKHKVGSADGLPLLSLERLEEMNRRAINWAFPLFTGGLLIGLFLWRREQLDWLDPKIVSTAILWLTFIVLLYLRYGLHQRGRRAAFGSIIAFLLLIVAFTVHFVLPSSHRFGGGP